MSNELHFDSALQALREKSVDRLLLADVFDADAFEALLSYLDSKGARLKAEFAIPKQVLSCLRDAANSILSRAEYLPEVKRNIGTARQFELLLDLMIIGETLSDRPPGQPRVV
ncbi:MAG: hypothetical protein Q8L84_01730 [Hyphomonas sp.]|nr:hypothetical protein [Hyphomonas sp.]